MVHPILQIHKNQLLQMLKHTYPLIFYRYFALELLDQAGLPPAALATMFERFREVGGEAGGLISHFSSHPALGDRIARAAELTEVSGEPVLTPREWQALRAVCGAGSSTPSDRVRESKNK